MHGVTVRELLQVPALEDACVVAGHGGLDRVVARLNVMEVPDILPWVKSEEFLLTTAYPLRDDAAAVAELVDALDERGLAGMGIKVGRYLDAIPSGMVAQADARDFPLVQLPDGVGFDEILNQVLTDILNRQAATLARTERIHRGLLQIVLSGGGLPEVAEELAELLDAHILIADDEDRPLTAAGVAPPTERLRKSGVLSRDGELTLPGAPERGAARVGGYRLMVAEISAGSREHGRIVAVETGRTLEPEDLTALESAATVAALVITKEQAITAAEGRFQSDFLHDLLGERVLDRQEVQARARGFGWNLERELLVLVAGFDTTSAHERRIPGAPPAWERLVAAVGDALRERDPHAAVVAIGGRVVALTGGSESDRPVSAQRALGASVRGAAAAVLDSSLSIGVSRAASDPLALATAYDQAVKALEIGRDIHGSGHTSHFDDLGAYRLLSLIEDRRELAGFVHDVLGELTGSEPQPEELRRTLRVLLETNLNVAETARQLHFHYNTVRYRLEKLQQIVGEFTTDPGLRLDLHLALRILAMDQFAG